MSNGEFSVIHGGKVLNGCLLGTFVYTNDNCQTACIAHSSCKSINVEDKGNGCQLLGNALGETGAWLENKTGWSHKSTDFENKNVGPICRKDKPCPNGLRCVDICQCPGYKCYNCTLETNGFGCDRVEARSQSCLHIRKSLAGKELLNGSYTLFPSCGGEGRMLYCDMNTDGGGWTLVSKVYGRSKSPWTAILGGSLSDLFGGQESIFLKVSSLKELWSLTKFTQIRWRCYKKATGKVIDIATSTTDAGKTVTDYFLGNTDTLPNASLDSFLKLPDDTSRFSSTPGADWGILLGKGKWGLADTSKEARLYEHPFFVESRYHWNILTERWECDDNMQQNPQTPIYDDDYWHLFVR